MRVTCKTCHGTLEECECAYKSTDAVGYNQYVSMPGRWITGKKQNPKNKRTMNLAHARV